MSSVGASKIAPAIDPAKPLELSQVGDSAMKQTEQK
jgi:hypothetical protein